MSALKTSQRHSENIGIEPVVIAELKFSDVQRQILFADLVIAAHDPGCWGNFVGWRQYRKMLSNEAVAPLPEKYLPF